MWGRCSGYTRRTGRTPLALASGACLARTAPPHASLTSSKSAAVDGTGVTLVEVAPRAPSRLWHARPAGTEFALDQGSQEQRRGVYGRRSDLRADAAKQQGRGPILAARTRAYQTLPASSDMRR